MNPEDRIKYLQKLEQENELRKLKEQLPHKYTSVYKWQREFIESKNKMNLLTAGNQPLLMDELIPTPSGYVRNADLKDGDIIFNRKGKPVEIYRATKPSIEDEYIITFDDGSKISCGPNHQWYCKGTNERFKRNKECYGEWTVKRTIDIIEDGKYNPETEPRLRHSIPICDPIEYPEKEYSIDPYYLGVMISEGDLDDFIPREYKFGSVEQRKNLLSGLLDIDGDFDESSKVCVYFTSSPKLKDDFIEVLNSLGGVIESYGRFSISFKTIFNPFFIQEKSSKWKQVDRYKHERIIYKIEKTNRKVEMRCIEIAGEDKSFLASKSAIVTHNCGKSISLIIRAITHATEIELWPELWPEMIKQGKRPTQFWYLYEDKNMIMREFITKWIPEWLPRGDARYNGKYRWTYSKKDKSVEYIQFEETGVRIYFFSYGQGVDSLQASTVYEIFVDEELPFDQYDELSARLTIPRGYFNAGFTAVKGQDEWRRAMEPQENEEEVFPNALKRQISAYECLVKEDGTPGLWDKELIELRTSQCSTHAMVLQKIYGKFIRSEGLMVSQFNSKRHVIKGVPLEGEWSFWASVDPGSGGEKAHPAGVMILAVNEDCTKGRVVRAYRGDKIDTTNTMILDKAIELANELKVELAGIVYDKASRDTYLQGTQAGLPMIPANKARDEGFGLLNSLFKHDMLKIYFNSMTDETLKLKAELLSYSGSQNKTRTKTPDNLIDPLRYACMQIPWNLDKVIRYNINKTGKIKPVSGYVSSREDFIKEQKQGIHICSSNNNDNHESLISKEIDDYNDFYDEDYY